MDLVAFYQAFSPACFALLALWIVVVQLRIDQWQKDPVRQRRAYGVALHFVLPGMMGALALVDPNIHAFWQVSFAIVALGGALVMVAVRGFPVPAERGRSGLRRMPAADRLGVAAYAAAIVLYAVIGVLALFGGADVLRAEAVLLTILVFLGFNVAWLMLFEGGSRVPTTSSGTMG
jgi:cation transport ATPase